MKPYLHYFASVGSILAGALAASQAYGQDQAGVEAALVSRNTDIAPPRAVLAPGKLALPPLSQLKRGPEALGTQEATFVLRDIKVSESRLLSQEEISELKQPYLNRPITLGDVLALRDDLTRAIAAKGYVTSGAVVPPQNISDTLRIELVEGRLTSISVEGTKYLTPQYLKARLPITDSKPLDIAELTTAYQLLLEDRDIERINARLEPGEQTGQSRLHLSVEERPRNNLSIFLASDRSPSVGETRAGVSARRSSTFSPGDSLSGEIAATAGLSEARFAYSRPVTSANVVANLYAQGSHARILDKPLNALDAISDSLFVGGAVTVPIISKPGKSLSLTASVDRLDVSTDLMGQPFSFSPGAVEGRTRYSSGRLSLNYSYFSNRRSLSTTFSLSRGLSGNRNAQGIDRDFSYADVSFSGMFRLNDFDQRLLLRGSARLTQDRLYATEMFVIGGASTVRGYRQNALLGNQGYWVSAEYVIPLRSLLKSSGVKPGSLSSDKFTLGLFADTGSVTPATPLVTLSNQLSSVGAHVTWKPSPRFEAELYITAPLEKLPYKGNYQDKGLGVRLAYHF